MQNITPDQLRDCLAQHEGLFEPLNSLDMVFLYFVFFYSMKLFQ